MKYQVAIIGINIGAKHYEDFQKLKKDLMFTLYVGLQEKHIDNILSKQIKKIKVNFDEVLKVKVDRFH